VLSAGGSATVSEASVVKEAEFLVAVEAEQRARVGNIVHTASAIEAEWLLEYFPERVRSERLVRFNAESERVESSETMLYDALVLDETRRAAEAGEEPAAVLANAALSRGSGAPWDVNAVELLKLRFAFAAAHDARIAPLDDQATRAALIAHCRDKISFEELRREPFEQALSAQLGGSARGRLDQLAPAHVKLPSGRELKVHYELDRPPWVESRLQDFFGMLDGPRLGDGKVPLVLHLLAPNQRPVQVTTDLRGFWDRHYAAIRRELMRRYPRHSWPEDPRTAAPPAATQRRR
jgi:ATP-dependent helicase HrpB